MFLSRNILVHPISVGQITHVTTFAGTAIIFDDCCLFHGIFFPSTLLPSETWKSPDGFKLQYIIVVAWFESLLTRVSNLSSKILWNVMIISILLVVVDTVYSMFIHAMLGKPIRIPVGNPVARFWFQ